MKRILLLLILLLILSLANCSNNDSVIGPGETQEVTDEAISQGAFDDGDGDPWEDHGPDGDGDKGPPSEEPGQGDTTGGDGDKNPYEPHEPPTGD